ncbi:MAG: PadR family transcriptional regulator [Anaerolineae bacterium]|nr:PadR family transcriptional regulator [Anaerolineae bacterium]
MSLFSQLRKGSTEMALLRLLSERPMYGYEIAQELERRSEGYFAMQEGLLYPALHRLEKEGLLAADWRPGEGGPARKYYHVTPQGRQVLAASLAEWRLFRDRLTALLEGGTSGHAEPLPG